MFENVSLLQNRLGGKTYDGSPCILPLFERNYGEAGEFGYNVSEFLRIHAKQNLLIVCFLTYAKTIDSIFLKKPFRHCRKGLGIDASC
jgi:hypothetical protein